MATIKDIAELARVSTATVSRVMNHHPQIADETRSRVLQAMEQVGYEPSRVARRMRMKTTNIVGLILSDIANPFFASVVRGIEDLAYANGYSLLLCNSNEELAREELYVRVLLAEKVAGVIVSPTHESSPACKTLVDSGIPVVAMDRYLCHLDVDTVVVDNVHGSYEAVSHLIALGHQRIALIGGPTAVTTGRERQEGYEKALKDHGITVDESLIKVGTFRQDSGYQKACELLEMDTPPTAIFAANNLMTLGALNAIHEKGLSIPGNISIVGFDDMPWASSLNPPLTAVAQPAYELGQAAGELLLARIAEPERPARQIRLETHLVIRESCGGKSNGKGG